ncbi:E3 ubiquitin-protein ligase RNF26 [Hondaea fermentalgiana]|uniref:E3 ubiquitin-protein ligase RNF26 n=1 Tax=Hondaea fermentalgiana TaxID=2315210 RepID=A0A2R5H082_9STRA|nr:E3 ubiquitin-protein ligase RNF26 [Hondaea fermentalgiana]|eukprot:GBG34151.1 E3 ubiquitin-protein ligase RNF26 [Hondaea fermentalgiana]
MSVFDFGDPCNSNHSSSSMRDLLKRTTSGGGSAHREEFENTHSDNVDGMDPVDGTDPSSREEVSRDALAKLAPSVPHMSEKEFRAQDAKLVEDAEAERNAAVKDMSARFCEGFEAEWALQRQRMDAACTTMLRGLDEQLAEEKGREDLARSTWEFQMRKAAKEDARLMDNLQATQDESKLCDAQLARFHSSAQDLASTADSDELQQLMATLLHTARLVRREKDTRMNDQLSALADVVKCVICQDHARSVVFMPCRHLCVCPSCRKQLQRNECPMCRARIESSVNVVLNEGSIRN